MGAGLGHWGETEPSEQSWAENKWAAAAGMRTEDRKGDRHEVWRKLRNTLPTWRAA